MSDFVAVVSSELSVVRAGAGGEDANECEKNGALGKRPYRRCCGLQRKQAALAGGGSGDRRLQVGRVA